MEESRGNNWDVIVIGGALSGAATACLLLRRNPKLRLLILERSDQLKRRVGESTVEISAYFLGRVLGLTAHLLEKHIPKQGMRFWFANDKARANLAALRCRYGDQDGARKELASVKNGALAGADVDPEWRTCR